MPLFAARNPDYAPFLEDYVARQGFLNLLGVELVRADPGNVDYRVAFRPDLGQHNGMFHGGVIGGLAEAVMGAAAASLIAPGHDLVGAEYKVNLMAPGAGEALIARGVVVRPGRRLMVCRADLFVVADGAENLIAIGQGTMAVVEPRPATG